MSARMLLNNSINNNAGNDTDFFIIDAKSRSITPPTTFKNFGVESDQDANRVYFKSPRFVGDNLDLSALNVRVNYQNAKGEKDQYIVDDVTTDGDTVYFSWLLSRKCTAYNGAVMFIVCAVSTDSEGIVKNEWNTTLATGMVLAGLEVDAPDIPEDVTDVVSQLLDIVNDSIKSVTSVETQALTEIAEAKAEAVEAVNNTPNTLYANAIKGSASGEIIRVDDVSPITHNVAVKVNSKNLIPFPYFDTTKTVHGITFTNNGDGSITANGTATGNAVFYFTNLDTNHLVNGTVCLSGCPSGGSTFGTGYSLRLNYYVKGVETSGISDVGNGKVGTFDNVLTRIYFVVMSGTSVENLTMKPMLNYGNTATEYEPYIDPTTVTLTVNETTYTPDSEGKVTVESTAPTMTLFTDTEGVNIQCEYNRDSNVVISELVERITALEGGVNNGL